MAQLISMIVFICLLSMASVVRATPQMVETLSNILTNESMKLWPGYLAGEKPVGVNISFYMISFEEVDWTTGKFEIMGYLRLLWKDPRISFSKDIGDLQASAGDVINSLWVPDLYVRNSQMSSQHTTIKEDSAVRIKSDGSIFMVIRQSLVINCPQKLQRFPFDTQSCTVFIESFIHKHTQIQLAWMRGGGIQIDMGIDLRDYAVVSYKIGNQIYNYTSGSYQTLSLTFSLKRLYGHFVIYWFIPTVLTTAVTYLLFWLPEGALAAKSSLGGLLFLVFTILMIGSRMDTPRVTYMTAIDKWFTVHIFFLVFSLIEVITLHLLEGHVFAQSTSHFQNMQQDGDPEQGSKVVPPAMTPREQLVRKVLWVARLAYPAIYILFLAIYWGIYNN